MKTPWDDEMLAELSKPYAERRAQAQAALDGHESVRGDWRWFFRTQEELLSIVNKTDAEFEAEDNAQRAILEERQRAEDRHRLQYFLEHSGIPAKDHERLLNGVGDTQAVQAALSAVEAKSVIVVLSGRRGCGKTVAAGRWLVALSGNGRGLFIDAPRLTRWSRYDDDEMEKLERVGALVIDDLGMEYDDKHGAFRSFVDGLINARYSRSLPTLITTNLPANDFERDGQKVEGFKSRYGERIADRIRECGKFVELRGDSMRSKQA